MEGDPVQLKCSASVYNFTHDSIEWYKHTMRGDRLLKGDDEDLFRITTSTTDFSFNKVIDIPSARLLDEGRYICRVKSKLRDISRRRQCNATE